MQLTLARLVVDSRRYAIVSHYKDTGAKLMFSCVQLETRELETTLGLSYLALRHAESTNLWISE